MGDRNKIIEEYKKSRLNVRFGRDEMVSKKVCFDCQGGTVGMIEYIINKLYLSNNECEKIYIMNANANSSNGNPYDKVFKQDLTDDYEKVPCWGDSLVDYDEIVLNDIRLKIQNLFQFNDDFNRKIESIVNENNITHKTLGVHIRMHDWNDWHGGQYGYVYYEDYIKEIDVMFNNNDIDNIFVASDNHETLNKLKMKYGNNLIYADNISREDEEHINGDEMTLRRKALTKFEDEHAIISPFIDFATLLKCGYFIGNKFSNFSKAVAILGNMKFENIKFLLKK